MLRLTAAVATIALCASACSQSSGDASAGPSPTSPGTSAAESVPSTTPEPTTIQAPVETTAPTVATTDTLPQSNARVNGTAVGGNNGDEDREIRYSETVRNSDGSCRGWDDEDSAVRTDGLENGARVDILDDDDQVIGSGRVESSRWFDAAEGGDNWTCVFSYTATIKGAVPDSFRIRVAGLAPWRATPDPTQPGSFVSSVNSKASPDLISKCTDLADNQAADTTAPQDSSTGATDATGTTDELPLQEWQPVVRTYWSDAVSNLCAQGFPVTIERDCRPRGVGSDYAIKVARDDDPSIVLEDVAEVYPAAGRIPPGVGVVVWVATGRPC